MAKAKRTKLRTPHAKPYQRSGKADPKLATSSNKDKHSKPAPLPAPTIPFLPADYVLLVGEGDFSFSRSLLETYGCSSLVATSFDTQAALWAKYPQASSHIRALEEEDCKVLYGVDATKLGKPGTLDGGGKDVKKGGFNKVVFNFPHVGGLTKDVNRQVRHNQELLVDFFKSALPLLAGGGSIIVTIFEGEPYDLWNIRDIARHVGLKAGRSFRFQASAYPGYKHARTLGNIEGGGGWKGENRPARSYILEVNEKEAQPITNNKKKTDGSDSEDA
ncbi:hypothetical protein N7G274_008860 [Stereocaulon virgatum]|uniref:25S rRNA (uridine-N(3))-methyltransferase BMT5-like domain-containing protein n=1 Tax=Stereocaulon virgatum TaxID=373712 RepID=A0ABR4A0L0_9LECA